jgi:hypothetical protein
VVAAGRVAESKKAAPEWRCPVVARERADSEVGGPRSLGFSLLGKSDSGDQSSLWASVMAARFVFITMSTNPFVVYSIGIRAADEPL